MRDELQLTNLAVAFSVACLPSRQAADFLGVESPNCRNQRLHQLRIPGLASRGGLSVIRHVTTVSEFLRGTTLSICHFQDWKRYADTSQLS
jgi:hypothetical protein